jgi:hypothetical protein
VNKTQESPAAGTGIPSPDEQPEARSVVPGVLVACGGVVLAAWIVGGRYLFGVGGELTPVFASTIGLALVALHFFAGRAIARTARRGRRTRPAVVATLAAAWGCGILLGFTIPDITPHGLQTILSTLAGPGSLDLVVGLSNPLGIVMLATSIAALVLASGDASGRPLRAEEDDDEDRDGDGRD